MDQPQTDVRRLEQWLDQSTSPQVTSLTPPSFGQVGSPPQSLSLPPPAQPAAAEASRATNVEPAAAGGKKGKKKKGGGDRVIPPKKPKLTKAERRALQEKQRAAKAARKAAAAGGGEESKNNKKKGGGARLQFDDTKKMRKNSSGHILQRTRSQKQVALFSHLPQFERESSLSLNVGFSNQEVPSYILALGLKYAEGAIVGANARCVAMLTAFKRFISEFHFDGDLSQQEGGSAQLGRDMEKRLRPLIQFLIDCRPHSVSMGTAIKMVRHCMLNLPASLTLREAKELLCDQVDSFIQARITLAADLIVTHALSKITNGDVVLTYARSAVVEKVLVAAFDSGVDFTVVCVDSRPKLEGKQMLLRLAKHGLRCTYVLLNAVSYVMSRATKVLLGAAAFMSNGTALSRAGTAMVAEVAKDYNVPALFCCETYKFCERVQVDSICSNELGDPDELVMCPPRVGQSASQRSTVAPSWRRGGGDGEWGSWCGEGEGTGSEPLSEWRDLSTLRLLNLVYDLTPADSVSLVVTELGLIPPSSVPVVVREYRKEGGYKL